MKMDFSSMAKSNDESVRGAISIVIKNVDGSNSSSSGFHPHQTMKGVKSINSDKQMMKTLTSKYEKSKPELSYLSDASQKPNRTKGIHLPYQHSDTHDYSR